MSDGRMTWLVGAAQVRAALVMLGRPDAEVTQATDADGGTRVVVRLLRGESEVGLQLLGDRLATRLSQLVGDVEADELMGIVELS